MVLEQRPHVASSQAYSNPLAIDEQPLLVNVLVEHAALVDRFAFPAAGVLMAYMAAPTGLNWGQIEASGLIGHAFCVLR